MVKHLGKNTSLLRLVQERLSCKEEKMKARRVPEEKKLVNQVPHLHNDWIYDILLLLPIKSLLRLSCVCKAWFNLINSSAFIEAYIHRCETVFIFLKTIPQERPNTFFVESNHGLPEQFSIFSSSLSLQRRYIHFLEIQDGKGKIGELNISCFGNILATCNGLILVKRKQNQGGLIVMNPMTRKLIALPLGTLPSHGESYGFMFSHSANEYKVVHLFQDELRYTGCEILSLSTRSWKAVDGPSFGLFRRIVNKPVSAIGALHWFPDTKGSHYIVSMGIDDEKFLTITLPKTSKRHDRLVEIGGFLCFVTHAERNLIEVWILKGLCGKDWIKHHCIRESYVADLVPLSTLRSGREMVFNSYKDGSFYAYDFEFGVMKIVEMTKECLPLSGSYLPHINSLATWQALEP